MTSQNMSDRVLLSTRFFIPYLVLLFIVSCTNNVEALKERRDKNPSLNINYWGKNWKSSELKDRIHECPPELIEKIRIENMINGFKERPVAAKPTPEIVLALQSIAARMPHNLIEILRQRLIGIFAVKGMGGTGYADVVYDSQGNEKYGIIVLDADVLLEKNANDWATWKENSFFNNQKTGGVKIRMIIEDEENNTVMNGIRYVLLHEMGHILGMVTRAHTSWEKAIEKKQFSMDYPFQKLSWCQTGPVNVTSLFDKAVPERKYVSEYSFEKSKLYLEQAPLLYEKLQSHTNFPSLNSSQNIWEDFAESFVTYFHTEIDKRPWKVVVERKGFKDIIMEACWKEARCEDKKVFMRSWFENSSVPAE